MLDIEKAITGCILGTAVGDAMGLTQEGLSRNRQLKLFKDLDRYHLLFNKGLCSDDTEHTCMVAHAIITSGGDHEKFRRDFAWQLRWWLLGMPAGIGMATLKAILKLWLFFPKTGIYSAGNGPAMRSALIGVCFEGDRLRQFVKASSRLTHTDPKAECGAMAIALAARYSMESRPVNQFIGDLKVMTEEHGSASQELMLLSSQAYASAMRGEETHEFMRNLNCEKGVSGYMYHSVPAVLHAWFTYPDDYRSAIKSIIRCGGDTDSTAAMLGGIIGAKVGKEGIPKIWIDNLIEWPRSVTWMEALSKKTEEAIAGRHSKMPLPPMLAILARNMLFFAIVLLHGFRRLLPPY